MGVCGGVEQQEGNQSCWCEHGQARASTVIFREVQKGAGFLVWTQLHLLPRWRSIHVFLEVFLSVFWWVGFSSSRLTLYLSVLRNWSLLCEENILFSPWAWQQLGVSYSSILHLSLSWGCGRNWTALWRISSFLFETWALPIVVAMHSVLSLLSSHAPHSSTWMRF